MRIPCPYCGERGSAEFTYLGDASPVRPRDTRPPGADEARDAAAARAFHDYVYLRANPAGALREWWQHTGGCRAWLAVERDVSTHALGRVSAARQPREIAR